MTNFCYYATIATKHYILTIYQAKAIHKSVQHAPADGHPRSLYRSHIRIFNAFNHHEKAGRIQKDNILPNTQRRRILSEGKRKLCHQTQC